MERSVGVPAAGRVGATRRGPRRRGRRRRRRARRCRGPGRSRALRSLAGPTPSPSHESRRAAAPGQRTSPTRARAARTSSSRANSGSAVNRWSSTASPPGVAELLGQGAQRGDARRPAPMSATFATACARAVGQPAVGPFEEHPGAGPQRRTGSAAVAEVLDGDAQAAAVRRGGQRVGVRPRPARAGEEAPGEELAGARRGARPGGGRSGRPTRHPAPSSTTEVTRRSGGAGCAAAGAPIRQTSTDARGEAQSVHQKTVRAGRGQELLAGPELVGQGEPDAEVGVEVQQVPGLVAQPRPGRADAGHDDHDQARRAGGGEQHARVGRRSGPRASPGRRGEVAGGVAPGDQADVGEHPGERGEADQPVDHARAGPGRTPAPAAGCGP